MEIWILIVVLFQSKFKEEVLSTKFLWQNFFEVPLQEYLTGDNLENVPSSAKFGKYETKLSCFFGITKKPRVYRNCFRIPYVENVLNYVIFSDRKVNTYKTNDKELCFLYF